MSYFFLVLVGIVLLYIFSSSVKNHLQLVFLGLFKSRTVLIVLFSLILYPGVVVHELSHLIVAAILFVPVKGLVLVPKVIDGKIRGGSVIIEKVDVVRRTLVGIAPLFGGLVVLWFITAYLLPPFSLLSNILQITNYELPFGDTQGGRITSNWNFPTQNTEYLVLYTFLGIYLLFSVSSTMFSSKKDLEALIYTVPIVIVLVLLGYILGFQVRWLIAVFEALEGVFRSLVSMLSIALVIQGIVLILLATLRFILLRKSY